MKLKNVGALCKNAKSIVLYDDGARQWAGEGGAMYILPENLGRMTVEMLCTIFDIPADKAADFYTQRSDWPTPYDAEDDAEEDELIFDTDRRVMFDKRDMVPLQAPYGKVYFVQAKYLKAVDDSENLHMTLRLTEEGQPYIAVKDGMFLTAIIMPVRVKPTATVWLGQIYNGSAAVKWESEE